MLLCRYATSLGFEHRLSSRSPASVSIIARNARRLNQLSVLRAFNSDGPDLVQKIAKELDIPRQPEPSSDTATQTAKSQQLAPGDVLAGKYTIKGVLGQGANAITYKAEAADGKPVAVKALSLSSLRDWKQLELFQRESRILASLDHPGIPRYIDYFEEDSARDRAFFIVQEAVEGKSLAALLAEGSRCGDEEATRIARELLGILKYLSGLRPPVIHRDVKPENIVLEGGRWGGRVYLVDFGGVQGIAGAGDAASLASTVVGTYGYMAPEQFRGGAQPASDLYGLGATLLCLLTGQPPSSFPQERMRIQWRGGPSGWVPPTSPMWSTLLDGLLEPVAEDRLSADEALAVLRGERLGKAQPGPASASSFSGRRGVGVGGWAGRQARRGAEGYATGMDPLRAPTSLAEAQMMTANRLAGTVVTSKPAGSRVILERTPTRLDITIPPKGLTADVAATGMFAIFWNAFVAVWTAGALMGGGILFALFSTPFWFAGVMLARQAFGGALMKERMAIGRNRFRLGQELAIFSKSGDADFLGGDNEKIIEGSTSDLQGARVLTTMFVNDQPQTCIELLEGVRRHRFGEGLELSEQQWLVHEINSHLEDSTGSVIDYDAFPPPEMPRSFDDRNRDTNFPDSNTNN